MPKVSICIPAYRQPEYLHRALSSVRAQQYTDYEVVITDDSPDDSVEATVCTFEFGRRLKYHRNTTPLGSPENWNEAVRRASAEYLKVLHHDDYFPHQYCLGSFVDLLDKHPQAEFGFAATRIDDVLIGNSREYRPTEEQLKILRSRPELLFVGNIIGAPSATIYRRRIDLQYDAALKYLVDIDFYIRLLKRYPLLAYSPEVLICTTSNARHQVTEICKDNGSIELFEYARLFSKIYSTVAEDNAIANEWLRLFRKYEIVSWDSFRRYGVAPPLPETYFKRLLRRRRKERVLELIRRLYHVIRAPAKKSFGFFRRIPARRTRPGPLRH